MKINNSIAILFFALAGIGLTGFLTYEHYHTSNFCNINDRFSCDTVNKSVYSEFFGIPVALFGVSYFAIVAYLSLFVKKKNMIYIFYLSLIAIVPSVVLTYIELFVLHMVCIICESSKILIIATILTSYFSLRKSKSLKLFFL